MINKSSFRVPDDYFSSLESRIVVSAKKKAERRHYLRTKVYPTCVAIAAIMIVGGIFVFNNFGLSEKERKPVIAQMSISKQKKTLFVAQSKETQKAKKTTINKPMNTKRVKALKNNRITVSNENHNTNKESLELTKSELEYLGSYLQGDIVNDYLAYY